MEQLAIVMAIGLALFVLFRFLASRRGRPWRRFAMSAGILGALALVSLGLAYTVAPNIPTPPVPLTARFAQNPVPDTPEAIAAGKALYQKNCAVCHGPKGLGDGPAAYTLTPRPFNLQLHVPQHAPGEIYYWISAGVASTPMAAGLAIGTVVPVSALGDTSVTLNCSDGTSVQLLVDTNTLNALTDAVNAMTLYPAGLTCSLIKNPLGTALFGHMALAGAGTNP